MEDQFTAARPKKVKKLKKTKKKPTPLLEHTLDAFELPQDLPDLSTNVVNRQENDKPDKSLIPQIDFDPNENLKMEVNVNAPLGKLNLDGIDDDLNLDDDFDYEDVQIQGNKK